MRIELFFDFSCPYAYIASTLIEDIAHGRGAELSWQPMLLGGVFRGSGADGSPMDAMGPAKARHNRWDIARWASYHNVPLAMPKAHPMRTLRALRALLSLPQEKWPPVIHGFYRAYWIDGRDITSAETLRSVLAEAGLSDEAIARGVAANDDPAIKAELRRRTDDAVARGVFGAPAAFIEQPGASEPLMFWGQDRLHMVDAALASWIPGQGKPPHEPAAALKSGSWRDGPAAAKAGKPAKRLTFYYDFASPFAYLGATRIEAVAARAGVELRWRPMLLGAVFREIGTANVPLFAMPQAKQRYIGRDLEHWASYWGVPFSFAGKFPQKTVTALRLALLAGDRIAPLSHRLFRAMWAEDRDLEDPATLAELVDDVGLDGEAMVAKTREPAVKQMLIDSTAEAIAAGVFGAPTCIVEREDKSLLFWGQDRLELVAAALAGWSPALE